ncbi:MAG TPA: hypothetical protein VNW97_04125 [Candidatus Saccharimonadales bacterium]|jgi:alkylhydroperoxidase family enzyme|nr:hypothetical protein [Candidatus Saccharimonadales bacterium]
MVLPKKVQKVIEALLGPSGKSDQALRQAVFERTRSHAAEILAVHPEAVELCALVEKISERPWTVSDEDFDQLRQVGYSEDQIFDLTVASAAGAGVRRFEAGLRALTAAAEKTKP